MAREAKPRFGSALVRCGGRGRATGVEQLCVGTQERRKPISRPLLIPHLVERRLGTSHWDGAHRSSRRKKQTPALGVNDGGHLTKFWVGFATIPILKVLPE